MVSRGGGGGAIVVCLPRVCVYVVEIGSCGSSCMVYINIYSVE